MSSLPRQSMESRLSNLYKTISSDIDASNEISDPLEKGFSVVGVTRNLIDLSNLMLDKKRHNNNTDDNIIFTILESTISFFLTDTLCSEDLLPILNAFLPLYTECTNFVLTSSQFCKNEYESAWKNFKIEFSKAEKSIIPFNLRHELRDYLSSSDILRTQLSSIRQEIDQHMNLIDIRISQISSFINVAQQADLLREIKDTIIKFRLHITDYIASQSQGKLQMSPGFFLYSKVLEEAVDNAQVFYKLHELIKSLSLETDIAIPSRKKLTPQFLRTFLLSSIRLFGMIIKQISMINIPDLDQNILFKLFNQIYSLNCAIQVQKEGNISNEWKELELQLSKCNLKPNISEEDEAMSILCTTIKNNAGDYRTILYDLRKIEKLFAESKESLKDVGKLNELTIFLQDVYKKVESVETQRCIDSFKFALSSRFLIGHAFTLCENIQTLVQYIAGPNNSTINNPEKSAQSLLECLKNLKLFEISEFESFSYAYTQYLEYVQLISKSNPQKGRELLAMHPTEEALRQCMKPSERFLAALRDVWTREESGAVFIEASRLHATSFPSLAWIERCSAFYLYSSGHCRETQGALFAFELIGAFFRSASAIREAYARDEPSNEPKTEDNSGGKIPKVIRCVLDIAQTTNSTDQRAMLAALEPLVLYTLFELDIDIDAAFEALSDSVVLPDRVEVLQRCYDTIDAIDSCSRTLPDMAHCGDTVRKVLFDIFRGELPEDTKAKLKLPDQLAAALSPKERKDIESGLECITSFVNGSQFLFPLLPLLKINAGELVRCFSLANHCGLIRSACQNILKAGAVRPERADEVRSFCESIDKAFSSWRLMDVHRGISELEDFMKSFWSMGAIDRNDYLSLYLVQALPSIERLIGQCSYLSQLADVPRLLKQATEIAAQYRMTRNRITLLNITDVVNTIKERVLSAERKASSFANTILEISLINRQLVSLNTRIAMIRTVSQLEAFPVLDPSQAPSANQALVMVSFEKAMQHTKPGDAIYEMLNTLGQEFGPIMSESFSDIIEYIKERTPADFIDARICEAKKLKEEMEAEIENLESETAALPMRAVEAKNRAQDEINAFDAELSQAEAMTNENQRKLEELSAKHKELVAELEKVRTGKTGDDVLTSDVPSVVRMLLNDDVSLDDFGDGRKTTEADFIADQLQEALRTNLRLKKSLEVLDFPREKALFTAQEFANILDKFTPPAGYDTPFVPRRANEGASLRQTLKELNAERDSLVRQVVALNSTPVQKEHDADDLYAEMVALSTTDVSGRRTHKESFLEFADVSDQFFLEAANESERLEQEILDLKSGRPRRQEDPSEVRSFLLKRLEKNIQMPH